MKKYIVAVGQTFLSISSLAGLQLMNVLVILRCKLVVVIVGHTVGSISSKTLTYDFLWTLELCTASIIVTSLLGHLADFMPSVCPSCS